METKSPVVESSLNPPISSSEELVDIPSEHIKGHSLKRSRITEFALSDDAKRLIFERLLEALGRNDEDGYEFSIEWGPYTLTSIHHYECQYVEGGDSYRGCVELYPQVTKNIIEVSECFDNVYQCFRPTIASALNYFFKRDKLQ